jgi:sirohydrochlorin cobaltochelatase
MRSSRPDELLRRHAASLEGRGRFAEVRAATLAGTSSPREALAGIRSRNIVIVPMLMCDGVFCREALPAALGLAGGVRSDGRILHLCPPIGLHPMVADLVVHRATRALKDHALSPAATTLLLIGHGSTHDPASERAVALQAERIRASSNFRSVMTAFIDQPPFLPDVLASVHQPLIGVALFSARGNHVVEDIEKQFSKKKNSKINFLGTLGEDEDLINIIELMVAEQFVSKDRKVQVIDQCKSCNDSGF